MPFPWPSCHSLKHERLLGRGFFLQGWVEGGISSLVLANVKFEILSEMKMEMQGRPLSL